MLSNILSAYGFLGIDNKSSRYRILPIRGQLGLIQATNVDIDRSGAVYSVRKPLKFLDGNFSSLFQHQDYLFFVRNSVLCVMDREDIISELHPVSRWFVDFSSIGPFVFFTGDEFIGKIFNLEVEFPDREVSESFSHALFDVENKEPEFRGTHSTEYVIKYGLPTGEFCSASQGRVFSASENVVRFSNPLDYLYMSQDNFLLTEGVITSLTGTPSFLFIGTDKGAFSLRFSEEAASIHKLSNLPVLYRSSCPITWVPQSWEARGDIVIFANRESIYITDGSECKAVTNYFCPGAIDTLCSSVIVKSVHDGARIFQYVLTTK
jgi:hypothetical protein